MNELRRLKRDNQRLLTHSLLLNAIAWRVWDELGVVPDADELDLLADFDTLIARLKAAAQ